MAGQISFEEIEQARAPIPRTLMLVGESKSASWAWRVEWPCKAMRDRGYIADWVGQNQVQGALFAIQSGRYNTIITPRAHWPNPEVADAWINEVHGFGLAWAYELDDDGWSPEIVAHQSNLFENEWEKGEVQLEVERQERIELIKRADGVIVSTNYLGTVARQYTDKPVWVVPNLIDVDWFISRTDDAKRMVPPLTVGWSGGLRDEGDLDIVAEAWRGVAKRFPEVKFIVHGVTPMNLAKAIPQDRLVLFAWSTLPDYPRALMNIDVACCAVKDGVNFNLSKSPIKWMEASLSGAACVVSKAVYGEVVTHNEDAFVCETASEWEDAICELLSDEQKRRDIVERAKQKVFTKHSLRAGWPIWIEALAGILKDADRMPTGLMNATTV